MSHNTRRADVKCAAREPVPRLLARRMERWAAIRAPYVSLYDPKAVPYVARVVARVLKTGGEGGAMAILADPEQREHRDSFADTLTSLGLETVEADFPGHDGMKLLQSTRMALTRAEA